MAITKDMSILEVVQKYPDTVDVFVNAGMGCLGCAAAHFENIEQARWHTASTSTSSSKTSTRSSAHKTSQ